MNGIHALKPVARKEVDESQLRIFGTLLKAHIAWSLEELKATALRAKKPLNGESYKPLADAMWALTRVEVPMEPAAEDGVPQRLAEMAADPFGTIKKHRVTRFDKPLPEGGVLLPALSFSGACGPMYYKWKCEGKVAAWVRGAMTEVSTMSAEFALAERPTGEATLEMDGQDCDSVASGSAPIRISVNGKAVFTGVPGFASRGWSRETFKIPAGVLKQGDNVLTIKNLANSDSRNQYWVMISEAKILFPGK